MEKEMKPRISLLENDRTGRLKKAVSILTTSLLCLSAGSALAIPVPATVPGTANPYLAGMPAGSTCCSGDLAPAQSPTQVLGLGIAAGAHLSFSVTGSVAFSPSVPTDPPDGSFIVSTPS